MIQFIKENQTLAIVVVVCITVLLALAMWFGLDLSWIPGLLTKWAGG